MKRTAEAVFIGLIALALTCIYLWPLPSIASNNIIINPDSEVVLYVLDWQAYSLVHDISNFFNIPMGYPGKYNLATQDFFLGAGLFYIPFKYMVKNPILALNLTIILIFTLTLVSTYLLSRSLGMHPIISFFIGFVFTFYSYHTGHLPRTQLQTLYFFPLCLLFMERYFTSRKRVNIIIAGLLYACQTLSCWYYGFFLIPILGLYLLLRIMQNKLSPKVSVQVFAIFASSSLILILPFSIPYFIKYSETPSYYQPLEWVIQRGLSWRDLFNPGLFLKHYRWLGKLISNPIGIEDHSAFIGFIPYLLLLTFLFPFIKAWRSREIDSNTKKYVLMFLALGLLSYIISMGVGKVTIRGFIPLPYYVLYKLIPGFKSIRAPSRANVFFIFSLLFVLGFMLQGFIAKRKISKPVLYIFSIAVLLLSGFELMPVRISTMQCPLYKDMPIYYKIIKGLPDNTVLLELYPYISKGLALPKTDGNDMFDGFTMKCAKYMYYATYHRKKLANMYVSYPDPYYKALEDSLSTFPSKTSTQVLRDRRYITHILVRAEYPVNMRLLEAIRDEPLFKLMGIYNGNVYLIRLDRDAREQSL